MCDGTKVVAIVSSFLKDWSFCSLDLQGRSRVIVTGCNNSMELINSSFLTIYIQTKLEYKELGKVCSFIYVYGPYEDRKARIFVFVLVVNGV